MHRIALRQPVAGVVGTALCLSVSLTICSFFTSDFFGTWVTAFLIAAIPFQIVISLVWKTSYPGWLGTMRQPAKGIVVLLLMALAGAAIGTAAMATIGGGATPPTPFVIMLVILSVVCALWIVVVFQCWPLTAFSKNQGIVGGGVLLLSYVAAWVLYSFGMNFSEMAGAPFYAANLDPGGALPAWTTLTFAMTTLPVILGLLLWNFWPLTLITRNVGALSMQPLFGILAAAFVLALSWLIWTFCVRNLMMDPVDYLVRVPVSVLFGEFIVLLLFQGAGWLKFGQGLRYLAIGAAVALLAVATYALYSAGSTFLVGMLPAGPPAYLKELWIASAMLAITFPFIVAFAESFGYWPFQFDG